MQLSRKTKIDGRSLFLFLALRGRRCICKERKEK